MPSGLDGIDFRLRPPLSDDELNALFAAAWPAHQPRAFAPVLGRSLAWIGAFADGALAGFVNLAWDGGAHVFLLDTTVHPRHQRRGVGTELVRRAVTAAGESGAEWLHVDYEPHLDGFYRRCGFRLRNLRARRFHIEQTPW
jgi:GNAT superfamily N-acetyltransferase